MISLYNRYVPQSDGSYTRNRVPDASQRHHPSAAHQKQKPETPPFLPPEPECPPEKPPRRKNPEFGRGFLRQLLPADFDLGDLIVVLLLLLMAGDCEEDRNNAILTIALYFLM